MMKQGSEILKVTDNAMLFIMHKIKQGKCPPFLLDLLPPDKQDIHVYTLD